MSLNFHPSVQHEINEVLDYYASRSEPTADRFWDDLQARLIQIEAQPTRFCFINEKRGLCRVRLSRFPYLITYYQAAHGIRVTCVKHEKRHPIVGMFRR